MNFTKCYKRIQFDRFASKPAANQPLNSRPARDPFEGDPFKIQSLKFRYAEKPAFYPVSHRGRGLSAAERLSDVKNIYYNHDHSIHKRDKENIPLRFGQPTASAYASKLHNPHKSVSSVSDSPSKALTLNSVASDYSDLSDITIKINGVLKNRVKINRSDGNVEISLAKQHKSTQPPQKQREDQSRPKHARSYVVYEKNPILGVNRSATSRASTAPKFARSSDVSLIPHREERPRQKVSASQSGETDVSSSSGPVKIMVSDSRDVNKSDKNLAGQGMEKVFIHNTIFVNSRKKQPHVAMRPLLARSSHPVISLSRPIWTSY